MAEYKRPVSEKELEQCFEQIKPYMDANMASYESSRCLYCFDAPCVSACPTGIDIPLFIRQINTGNLTGAAKTIYQANYFGNICGKVCPTEVLCEGACVFNHQSVKPLEIGRLQSYATSQAITEDKKLFKTAASNGKRVAIIGAGPAGISAACELRKSGYEVVIFEAKTQASGLVLYGCAPYKIANEDALGEVHYLQKQFGFTIQFNSPISSPEQLEKLEQEFDAILLGIGLGNTRSMDIEGAQLKGCKGATEFIEEVKINPLKTKPGKRVIVIGGGNTAMDAASESARLGAEKVVIAYRRSKAVMRAYEFEYELAKSVGVKGIFNVSPVKILGKKKVKGVRFIKTYNANGQLSKVPTSEFELKCDRVILATGQSKLTALLKQIKGLKLDAKGRIIVHPGTHQTTNLKYFAAGDAVNGGAEVVNAAAEGKLAAKGIQQVIKGG